MIKIAFLVFLFTPIFIPGQNNIPNFPNDFDKNTIISGLNIPMDFEVGPGEKIYVIQQTGEIIHVDPQSMTKIELIKLPVYHHREQGGLGIGLDPDFTNNQYIYVYFTPTPDEARLSRFTITANSINSNSEKILLTVPVTVLSNQVQPHLAGKIEFGNNGLLYLTTGENMDPINGSANTNSLKGKIIRIKPEQNGSYTIPSGNLFPEGTLKTRPEIYSMGHRNPFTFSIDPVSNWIYVAEVGTNWEEINLVKSPGNFGYPFYEGNNGGLQQNTSSGNTGLIDLPVSLPTWLTYKTTDVTISTPNIPGFMNETGSCAMAGPVYQYDNTTNNPTKLPAFFDGQLLWYDCYKQKIYSVKKDSNGNIDEIYPVFTGYWEITRAGYNSTLDSITLRDGNFENSLIIDMEIGNTGNLYVMEYFGGKIHRMDYNKGFVSYKDAILKKSESVKKINSTLAWPSNLNNSIEFYDVRGELIIKLIGSENNGHWIAQINNKFRGLYYIRVSNEPNYSLLYF